MGVGLDERCVKKDSGGDCNGGVMYNWLYLGSAVLLCSDGFGFLIFYFIFHIYI